MHICGQRVLKKIKKRKIGAVCSGGRAGENLLERDLNAVAKSNSRSKIQSERRLGVVETDSMSSFPSEGRLLANRAQAGARAGHHLIDLPNRGLGPIDQGPHGFVVAQGSRGPGASRETPRRKRLRSRWSRRTGRRTGWSRPMSGSPLHGRHWPLRPAAFNTKSPGPGRGFDGLELYERSDLAIGLPRREKDREVGHYG